MLRLVLAWVHLLALGIGLGAIWTRAKSLSGPMDESALRRAFAADTWWGFAAVLWIGTGVWRVLAATEKPTAYYTTNHVFFAKMGLLALLLLVEAWPMVTLIRWRLALSKRSGIATLVASSGARRIATLSYLEALLVVAMVAAAVIMARGYGVTGRG
jgi:putative membrane protein